MFKPIEVPIPLGLTVALVNNIATRIKNEKPETFQIIRNLYNLDGAVNIFEAAHITGCSVEEVYSVIACEIL